ncbi:hypothetical protein ACS0TY_017589 [Phlomoides rotata]
MRKEAPILTVLGLACLKIYLAAASLNMSTNDESSLLALKTTLNSDVLAKNWSDKTSFCTWIGVTCSPRYARVTALNLSNMRLRGSVAREIGNLSFLTFLDMSSNSIGGRIPGEIGKLRRLRVLKMGSNQLSEGIPQSMGMLRNLEGLHLSNNYLSGDITTHLSTCERLLILDLSYNNLTGDIPIGFGNLSRLQTLHLTKNQLTGELPSPIFNISSLLTIVVGDNQISGNIPNELWNLSSIQRLHLFRNEFTGIIPSSIANLSILEELDLGENSFHNRVPPETGELPCLTFLNLEGNNFSGELPQSVFNLSRLRILKLGSNNLFGSVPFSIDKGLPSIRELYLIGNNFYGKIPSSISNLSELRMVQLARNSFTGYIPTSLGNLRHLEKLHLARNQLTNDLSNPEQDFLSSLTACKHLTFIIVYANLITGVLPKSLGSTNLSATLVRFRASSCRIFGRIPGQIGNLSSLLWLDFGDNELTGGIPVEIGKLRNLQGLDVYGNKLHGSLSYGLCNLNNLFSVNLANNSLFGQIPGCLGNLSSLREINFADNAFSSSIPSSVWFNERIEKLNFSNNLIDGFLPMKIGDMESLMELDLSDNRILGEIPSTISELQKLISLSLSNNKLNGIIPESLSVLRDLQYLDLSNNRLSGLIPKSLEKLAHLSYFNVSFNELSGEIPGGGPFVDFTAELFTRNEGLCGAPRFKVEACRQTKTKRSRMNKLFPFILPAVASVVVASIILILVLRRRVGKTFPATLSDEPPGLVHGRISYYEILCATGNFDEENLIGRGGFGSVYKGCFSDAMVAAIKVFDLDERGLENSFERECQVMRGVRHRNLVKIITSCSNLDFKALVMVYMPNGNLEKWLYSTNCWLNIFQRLGIMIDVASALEYLHEGYTFPIVHCDLKPNNILLDEDMVAHVGDFGIAKLLTLEQRMQQTTTLGTIGYMAPEYGSEGLVSTMVDVYSYGILLMELSLRRKPTDEMFSGELTMKRWVLESFPDKVMEIVDADLVNMDDESRDTHGNCLVSIVGLALECTADLPQDRPNMTDVLARISKIKLNLSKSLS